MIAPDWSALGEWAQPAAVLVACTDTAIKPGTGATVGGVADRALMVDALDQLYRNPDTRTYLAHQGKDLAETLTWENSANAVAKALRHALSKTATTATPAGAIVSPGGAGAATEPVSTHA